MKKVIKLITLLADAGFFLWLGWLLIVDFPDSDSLPLLSFVVLILANTYLLVSNNTQDSWLELWFKRKALEEQKKISELEK